MLHRWEFKLISSNDLPSSGFLGMKGREPEVIEAYLNAHGQEGWEIIGIDFADALSSPGYFKALAKRERQSCAGVLRV